MKTLYLIDGFALAFRSYFALSRTGLKNAQGLPTGGLLGFTRAMLKLAQEEKPDYLAVAWDSPGKTFRHKKYVEYKAHRPKMPEDLALQIPYMEKVVEVLDIPLYQKEGFEADDVIATMVTDPRTEEMEIFIVSGDKDLMQLVSPRVSLLKITSKENPEKIGPEKVREKFGVSPEQMGDLLALMGDSADNVPGLPGVGRKRAANLLEKWGTLEEMLENIPRVGNPRMVKAFEENLDLLKLSRELVTLDYTVPISVDYDQCKWEGVDWEKAQPLFIELGFQSLIRKFKKILQQSKKTKSAVTKPLATAPPSLEPPKPAPDPKSSDHPKTVAPPQNQLPKDRFQKDIGSIKDLKDLVGKLEKSSSFCFYLQLTGKNPWVGKICGAVFYLDRGSYWVNWPVLEGKKTFFPLLQKAFSSSATKVTFGLKKQMIFLKPSSLALKAPLIDVGLVSYLLDPSRPFPNVEDLFQSHLPHFVPFSLQAPRQKTLWDEDEQERGKVGEHLWEIWEIFRPQIQDTPMEKLLKNVEMPLVKVLADMEWTGVHVDRAILSQLSQELTGKLEELTTEIYREAGETFNINSSQQLGHILFEKLKIQDLLNIKKIPKTKSGYSTNQAVLESLSDHPLARAMVQYRKFHKLLTTYIDPLPRLINPQTGRIHTTFHQGLTATGRLSSSNPNLQNIPIRTEIGSQIRKAFGASQKNWVILSADYSQIELRILAHFSKDKHLLQAFSKDEDIHRATASLILGLPPDRITPTMRSQAKAVNFGILYGMGAQRLSKSQGISLKEAKEFIAHYFKSYPQIKDYLDQQVEIARNTGKVTTLLGRQRLLPEIHSSHHRVRAETERMAINTPIQGSASDIIKLAMVNLHKKMAQAFPQVKMILQIHDELLFEVAQKDLEGLQSLVRQEMEGVVKLSVPLKVDIGWGPNWLSAH